ncbi:MAG: hypothetical protein ACYDEF_16840 [Methanosarcina sp.]|nr:hypothetical protein BGV40_04165 [Methanosarcina sp. Ant1]
MKEKMGCEKMTGAMTEGKMTGAMKEKMSGMSGVGCGKMAGAMTDKMNETMEGSETGFKGC